MSTTFLPGGRSEVPFEDLRTGQLVVIAWDYWTLRPGGTRMARGILYAVDMLDRGKRVAVLYEAYPDGGVGRGSIALNLHFAWSHTWGLTLRNAHFALHLEI